MHDNQNYEKTWAFGQCKRLSSTTNIQDAIKNLNKFDVIVNISMLTIEEYVIVLTNDVKKKIGWNKVDFGKKDNSSNTRNGSPGIRKKMIENLPPKELDFLKQKLKVDIDFYAEAVKLIVNRYNLKTIQENYSEIEFFDD